jgi:uncharacterized protein (TIGR02996 family)
MDDRDALLTAIHADPEAEAPRLVYADWLEEHGDVAQAELIRVDVELGHAPEGSPRWRELARRHCALFAWVCSIYRYSPPDAWPEPS